jgi:predicted transcriptional regulator
MSKPNVELTGAEWAIIKAVWEGEPCTAPALQQKLHKATRWSYSTVRTLMDRMVAKGLLTSVKVKNVTQYRSAITRRQAQRSELLYALKHAFNGALAPMVQCLLETKDVSPEELDSLKQLIAQHEKGRSDKTGGKP